MRRCGTWEWRWLCTTCGQEVDRHIDVVEENRNLWTTYSYVTTTCSDATVSTAVAQGHVDVAPPRDELPPVAAVRRDSSTS